MTLVVLRSWLNVQCPILNFQLRMTGAFVFDSATEAAELNIAHGSLMLNFQP